MFSHHGGSFIAFNWLRRIGRNKNHTHTGGGPANESALLLELSEGPNDEPSCLNGVAAAHPLFLFFFYPSAISTSRPHYAKTLFCV